MTTSSRRSRLHSERGSVLIQTAVAIVALLALCSLVIDYGVMWSSRRQIQNAADAGALAGAVSLSFDYVNNAQVQARARAVAITNQVWGQPPIVELGDIFIEPCPPTPGLGPGTCVRAQAFRNEARGNPLPTFFGNLVNVSQQGVMATATARAVAANAANCLRPWAVADKWLESTGPWTQQSEFQPPTDVYTPPSAGSPGTGFSNTDANGNPVDHGMQLTLKIAHSGPPQSPGTLSAGWSMALDLPNPETPAYSSNINGCTSANVGIAPPGEQCLTPDPSRGCIDVLTGAQTGPIANPDGALAQLLATDSGARWQNGAVVGSAYPSSPRIVPIAVFDPDMYLSRGYNGTQGIVKVVNILGFFIEGSCRDSFYQEPYLDCSNNNFDVVGRLIRYSGVNVGGNGEVAGAFGQVIMLVR